MSTETRAVDIGLDVFAEGVKLLGEKDLEGAAAKFEQVVAETDGRHLRDRARQYLAACRHNGGESIEDPYLAAVYYKNQGDLDKAAEHCAKGDDSERFVYLRASLACLTGAEEKALELLAKAIVMDPKNRVHAFHDSDFNKIHGTESFVALINPPQGHAT